MDVINDVMDGASFIEYSGWVLMESGVDISQ
jgi:hypothetical protein